MEHARFYFVASGLKIIGHGILENNLESPYIYMNIITYTKVTANMGP
jgi:hypothetical protein